MKTQIKYKLVLASQSPRRKELLSWMGIPFEIIVSNVEEKSTKKNALKIAEDIAFQKGHFVMTDLVNNQKLDSLVVGADTIVCLGNKIYGKPKDVADARAMLQELGGKNHKVVTAVYIGKYNQKKQTIDYTVFSCTTKVHFKKIDKDLLENYLKTGDSLDKAGAYGIQHQSLTFIDHLEGSYSNVVGFPLDMFIDELKKFIGHSKDTGGKWRRCFTGS